MSELYKNEELDQAQEQSPKAQADFMNNLARLMDHIEFVPYPAEYQDEEDDHDKVYGRSETLGDYRVQYMLPGGALIEITQDKDWNQDRMFEVDAWYPEDEEEGWWVSSVPTYWTVRIIENGLNDSGEPWSIQHEFSYEAQNPGTEEDRDQSTWRVFHEIEFSTPEDIQKRIDGERRDLAERLMEDHEGVDDYETGDNEISGDVDDEDYADEVEPMWSVNQSAMDVFNETCRIMDAHREVRQLGLNLMSESELVGLNNLLASIDDSMLIEQSVDSYG
jgi:hypothetical protein